MPSTFPFLHLWSVEIEDDQLFLVQDTKPFSFVIQANNSNNKRLFTHLAICRTTAQSFTLYVTITGLIVYK